MQPSRPPQRSDALRNREQILEATRRLVGRHGGMVSMETIAAEAGVAVGTLYRHFPTKDALLQAIIAEKVQVLHDDLVASLDRISSGGSPWTELEAVFFTVVHRQAIDRAVKAAVALTPGASGGLDLQSEQRVRGLLDELAARARAEGSLRDDVSVDDVGWLLQGLPGDEVDEATRTRCARVVLDGLHPPVR